MGLSSKQVSSDHQLDHQFNWTQNISAAAADTSTSIQPPPSTSSHRSMKRPLQQSGDLAAAAAAAAANNLECPRCDSTNTKFCYYNNYNKTQPRHFCKACKRHWTKGGTLRNVPVGGGRKNNRRRIIKQRPCNNNNITTTVDHKSLGTLIGDHQKYYIFPPGDKAAAGLFFKPNDSEFDQVSWDFNTTMQHESVPHDQNLGFSVHPNLLTSMDHHTNLNIPMMIPTSFAPLLSSDLIKDDSTVTTTTTSRMISMIPNSSSQSAYMQQQQEEEVPLITTSINFLEPSYWTTCWNDDIDSMVQADLNKPSL